MAIIGTPEQVAAYKALGKYRKDTETKPIWNGAIVLDAAGSSYKNGAMQVMEWTHLPEQRMYMHIPAHWFYRWHDSIPLTKTGTVALAQIEKRVPGNLREVFLQALRAYKTHDKSDPEFVFIF